MAFEPDAVLGVPRERADMIVGKVKQGTVFFASTSNPGVVPGYHGGVGLTLHEQEPALSIQT